MRRRRQKTVDRNTLRSISSSWYHRQFKKQRGGCAICGRTPKKNRLARDHNHTTQKVRGLLCMICNRKVLGVLEKYGISPIKIVEYLKTYDPANPLAQEGYGKQ